MEQHTISESIVLHAAKNCRLRLSQKELSRFTHELAQVLEAFSKIDEVDVEKEEPSFQPIPAKNVFREDVAGKTLSNAEALANTIHKKQGYFLGPRVVD